MSFPELVNSFGAPAVKDILLDQDILNIFEDSVLPVHCSLPLNHTLQQHLDFCTAVAFAHSDHPQENLSWGLRQYINGSNGPWTERIQLFSDPAFKSDSSGVTQAPRTQFQSFQKGESTSLPVNSRENSVMSYHRPSAAAISYGLPASGDIDYSMFSGARQASGEGKGYHQRSTEAGYTYSKSSNGPSKSSKSSKSRPNHERDQGEGDEGAEYPNYIPSSSSRSKSRASSSADYACWFFKLDPVKYVDCMHVHGRSSDLKYAHLKNHFKDGTIPPEFDKNMSWDEVWSTLFPGTRQPNNKYYVINDMILSVLESASVNGDDVSRFLDTLVNRENREVVINRIHGLSRDQGDSPGAGPSSTSRRNRQNLQLPSFERTPRTVDTFFTPPSSSSSSSNTTPAISSRSSHRYTPSFGSYHHNDLSMIESPLDANSYPAYTDAVGTLSPTSPNDRDIAIYDETYSSLIWFGRDLPWLGLIDFAANYLEHACNRAGHEEPIRIGTFNELQSQYQWHETGQVAGSCPFTLTVHRRA